MSFGHLKNFCAIEGLYYSKLVQDTNNGKIITLQVRKIKPLNKAVIFSKSKWIPMNSEFSSSQEKVINLLAFQFFEELGLPTPNLHYWGLSNDSSASEEEEVEEAPVKTKSISKKKKESDFEKQIEQILDEEEGEVTTQIQPNPLNDIMKMVSGIEDSSPEGIFQGLSTPGGLQGIGKMLQNPAMNAMMSSMMMMMTMPPSGARQEATGEVPLVHTPEIPEVVPSDE
jgi:hypothetical protein